MPAHVRRFRRAHSRTGIAAPGRLKVVLLSLLVIGELATVGVRGTFAAYNARTANAGNLAAAGTLTLAMQAGSSTCDSWTSGTGSSYQNTNSNCGTLPVTSTAQYPGQTTTVDLAIENSGSEPGTLSVYAPYVAPCSPALPGICDATEFSLQETASNYTTPVACYYPSPGTSCAFADYSNPDSAHYCPTTGTLTDFTYCTYYVGGPGGQGLSLGTESGDTTRYFVLSFKLPYFSSPSVGNSYQGETATFSLTFELDEAPPAFDEVST